MKQIPPLLTIVRGHQGSGKTTYAENLREREPDLLHFENDHFLMSEDGYVFDWAKYAQAKEQCLQAVAQALDAGNRVIMASTFTTLAEMQPYLDLADGQPVRVVEMFGDFPNSHDVPQAVVDAKKAAFEPYPGALQVRNEITAGRRPGLK